MMARAIPVRNLYYLFLYAWNRLQEGRAVDVSGIKGPELPNLLAKVLLDGTHRLLRRGLDRGYVEREEETARIRGRIRLSETIGRGLLARARVSCRYDELNYDVLHNQILKSTVNRLGFTKDVDGELRHHLKATARALDQVTTIRLGASDFRRVQLHGNNALYNFLIKVCSLVHEALVPEEGGTRFRFRDIVRDERRMALVFQDFVYNFYRLEQAKYEVKRERIHWDVDALFGSGRLMLPTMQTDVSLRAPGRTILIETKYYLEPLQTHQGRRAVRSEHLYQLFAYLKNCERRGSADERAEGVLLYASAHERLNLAFRARDHVIRVRTLDLDQDWRNIHNDLLAILSPGGLAEPLGNAKKHPPAG